jgi:hypothetical protein
MYLFVVCDDSSTITINSSTGTKTLKQCCWNNFSYFYVDNVVQNDKITIQCVNGCGPGGMNVSYIWNKCLYTLPNNGMEGIANIINYQVTGNKGWTTLWTCCVANLLPWMKNYIQMQDAGNCAGTANTYMNVTFNVGSTTNNNIFSNNLWCYYSIDNFGYMYINDRLVHTKSSQWNEMAQVIIPNVNNNDKLFIKGINVGGPGGLSLTYVYKGLITSLPSSLPGFNSVINILSYYGYGLIPGNWPGPASFTGNLIFNTGNWLNSCNGNCEFGIFVSILGPIIPPTSPNYIMSATELDCYKKNYPQDLSNMNAVDLQNHWKTIGAGQSRNNQCPSQQTVSGNYSYKGCFNDRGVRAIPKFNKIVTSIDQCAQIAESNNQNVFGVQYNGQCFTGLNPDAAYQYGANFNKSSCPSMGGSWTNQVYTRSSTFPSEIMSAPTLSITNFTNENFKNIMEEEDKDENIKNIFVYIIIIIIIILLVIFYIRMTKK